MTCLLMQVWAMSVFLCCGTKYIERKQWRQYIMTCLLATMLHIVSLTYFTVHVVLFFIQAQ